MGPPSRSFAADAYDCIMVRIRIGSTEYKCVARGCAPDGELPSDHQASGIKRRRLEKSPFAAHWSGAAKPKEQALEPLEAAGKRDSHD